MSSAREDEVVTMVRSCLLSVKGQMTLADLNRDYEALVGERIPYRILGYDNLERFLERLPGMEVSRGTNGNLMITASATSSTKHLADMVSKQKTTKKSFVKSKVHGKPWQNTPNPQQNSNHNSAAVKPANSKYLGKNFDPNYRWKPSSSNTNSNSGRSGANVNKNTNSKYSNHSQQYVPAPRFQNYNKGRSPSPPPNEWEEEEPCKSPSPPPKEEVVGESEVPECLELSQLHITSNGTSAPPPRRPGTFRGACKRVVPRGSSGLGQSRSELSPDDPDAINTDDNEDYQQLMTFAESKGYPRSRIKKMVLPWITYFSVKIGWFTFEQQMTPGRTLESVIDCLCAGALITLSRLPLPYEHDYLRPEDPMNRIIKMVYTTEGGVLIKDLGKMYQIEYNEELQGDWLKMLVERKTDAIMEVATNDGYDTSSLSPLLIPRFKKNSDILENVKLPEREPVEDLDYEVTHGYKKSKRLPRQDILFPEEYPDVCLGIGYSRARIRAKLAAEARAEALTKMTPVPAPTQIPETVMPRGILLTAVVASLGPSDNIFLRIRNLSQDTYDEIRKELDDFSKCGGDMVLQPVKGNCYVMRIESTWQRVELVRVDGESGEVLLLDTGERHVLPLALFNLTPNLAQYPAQALPYTMIGMAKFATDSRCRKILKDLILGQKVHARRTADDKVTLHREREAGQPLLPTSLNFRAVEAMSQGCTTVKLPAEGESRQFKIEMVCMTGVVYVRAECESNSYVRALLKLLPPYQQLKEWLGPVEEIQLLNCVYLIYNDNEFCRVTVHEADDTNEITVFKIDVGMTYECQATDLIPLDRISTALKQLPPLLLKMHIYVPEHQRHLTYSMYQRVTTLLPAGTPVMAKTMEVNMYNEPKVELSLVQPGNVLVAINDSFAFTRLQREMPQLKPRQSSTTPMRPRQPQALSAQPQALSTQQQALSAQPQALSAQLQALSAQPQALSAQPQALSAQPQALSAQTQREAMPITKSPGLEPRSSAFSAVQGQTQLTPGFIVADYLRDLCAPEKTPAASTSQSLASEQPTIPTPSLSVGVTPLIPTPVMPLPHIPIPYMPEYQLPLQNIPPVGSHYDIHVPLVSSPSNFFVQPYDLTPLNLLMQQMSEYYFNSLPTFPVSAAQALPGTMWAVQHADGHWYRGVVIGAGTAADSVSVMICDYGDVRNITFQQMRYLEEPFRMLPAQAVRAGLYGIKPKHRDWSMIDCILFQELVSDREFVSVVMEKYSTTESPNELKVGLLLIDTSGDVDIRIDQLLVDEQKAVFIDQR